MAATFTRDSSSEPSPGQQDHGHLSRELFHKRTGLGLDIILSLLMCFFMPVGLDHNLCATAGVAVFMAMWWISEAIPIAITALLPPTLFPILNLAEIKDFSDKYIDPTISLSMGDFLSVLVMQRWSLHKCVALWVPVFMGPSSKMPVLGFMVATDSLSMQVSNTATATMILPIGVSVLSLIIRMSHDEKVATENVRSASKSVAETPDGDTLKEAEEPSSSYDPMPKSNLDVALMLGIAYAASVDSLNTITGTPPNAMLVAYMTKQGANIGFGQWTLLGAPVTVMLMLCAWFPLTSALFEPEITYIPGGRELTREELERLDRMSVDEHHVPMVFIAAALAWVFVPVLLSDAKIVDAIITVAVSIALLITSGGPDGVKLMRWENTLELPWGVLLLFDDDLVLSSQSSISRLSDQIGEQLSTLGWVPVATFMVVADVVVLSLAKFTSNAAMAVTFLPLVGAMAVGLSRDQMIFAIPVALVATSAFMMPVAAPPNTIVYGSGYVSMDSMVKAGV